MPIDYIIGGLMFSSAAVNILALAAFWISPGLRTTANRFVINLLIVNVCASIIMIPSMFINGGLNSNSSHDQNIDDHLLPQKFINSHSISRRHVEDDTMKHHQRPVHHHPRHLSVLPIDEYEKRRLINDIETKVHEKEIELLHDIQTLENKLKTEEINQQSADCNRFWGFDVAAALGGLSVVLVVGDTWCAVTDPLRYHSRISYAKSWILIASVWIVGVLVGIASFLRNDCIHMDFPFGNLENVYDLSFSCIYFVLIILLPICTICIMYWKIFSEARQSGLRMRRNGSSPLLQSALNLTHYNNGRCGSFSETNRCPSMLDIDALTLRIDDHKKSETIKSTPVATHQYRRFLDIPKSAANSDDEKSPKLKPKLTQFKRNNSTRILVSLEPSPRHINEELNGTMRQVQSSPNLQKLSNLDLVHKVTCCSANRSTSHINGVNHQSQHTTASPKALSYMISIRHRLSNASSIFKYREESRTARISTLVVFMFLFSYFPYGLLVLLQPRAFYIENTSLLSILFILIATMTSPFIFAYRNRRVRRGVCRLFGIDAKPNNYLQKQRIHLRNEIATNHSKHVRIHRNLSASNFSLNLLPYKMNSTNILPLQLSHELYGITEIGSCTDDMNSSNDSVGIPIENDDSIDMKHSTDSNNNDDEQKANGKSDRKISFFKRMLSKQSSISSTTDEHEPVDV